MLGIVEEIRKSSGNLRSYREIRHTEITNEAFGEVQSDTGDYNLFQVAVIRRDPKATGPQSLGQISTSKDDSPFPGQRDNLGCESQKVNSEQS